MKKCTRCQKSKPLAEFHKRKKAKDGHQTRCKECQRFLMREHQRAHPKENLERVLEWQEANWERVKAYYRRIYKRHTCRFKALDSNWKAKQLGIPGKLTEAEVKSVLDAQGGKCLRCGKKRKLSIDHVQPFRLGRKKRINPDCTNTVDNIQGLCKPCNSAKGPKCVDYRKAA